LDVGQWFVCVGHGLPRRIHETISPRKELSTQKNLNGSIIVTSPKCERRVWPGPSLTLRASKWQRHVNAHIDFLDSSPDNKKGRAA
jgi:hypothetical protein